MKLKTVKSFVVSRKLWLRGIGCMNSYLKVPPNVPNEGKQCCLGFFCLKAGYSERQIIDKTQPDNLDKRHEQLIGGVGSVLPWVIDAMNVNDEISINNRKRENKLIKLFGENGIKLKFTA